MRFIVPLFICATAFAADPAATPARPAVSSGAAPALSVTAGLPGGSNLVEKGSYAFGATLANNLRLQGGEPDIDQVIQGFRDGLAGKAKMPEPEMREAYMAWMRDVRAQKMEKNRKTADEFLAKKAAEPDVKKFPDGLLYKVITAGKGPQPKSSDRVSAHYKGTLPDGSEFDSSYSRGKPFETPVMRVVPGWQEALTNMHVGDKWELYIPPQLAYGERGSPPKIGPNSALIFEMELLSILPPDTNEVFNAPPMNLVPKGSAPVRVNPGAGANTPIRITPAPPAK